MKSYSIKRILSLLLVACMALLSLSISTSASEMDNAGSLALSVSNNGSAVTAIVSLTDSQIPISGIDFKLSFDNDKLALQNASGSIFGFSFTDTEKANHKGYVNALGSLNSGATTSTGTVATFTFALNDGATGYLEFALISASCSDTNGNSSGLLLPGVAGLQIESNPIETYRISINQTSNGSVSSDALEVSANSNVTLMTKPNNGYVLDKLSVIAGSDTITVSSSGNTHTFTMPASNVTVSVIFKENIPDTTQGKNENNTTPTQEKTENNTEPLQGKNESSSTEGKVAEYSIHLKESENGTFTVDASSAAVGASVGVLVSPNEGYQTNVLMITDQNGTLIPFAGENDSYEFVMPDSDVTVEVSFEEIPAVTFAVSVSETQNGKVTVSKNSAGVGSVVTIHTVPDAGYQVATVEVVDASGEAVEATGSGNIYLFTMPESDVNITISFEEQPVENTVQQPGSENDQTWLWLLLAVLVVLVVLLIVLLTAKKKKYQPKY